MIKVTALTAFRTDPASAFRFRQFIAPLAEHGIDVAERYLPITRPSATADRAWNLAASAGGGGVAAWRRFRPFAILSFLEPCSFVFAGTQVIA